MNNEKHCSVIDAEGRHVTYVLVKIRDKPLEDGGTEQVEEVQNYTCIAEMAMQVYAE